MKRQKDPASPVASGFEPVVAHEEQAVVIGIATRMYCTASHALIYKLANHPGIQRKLNDAPIEGVPQTAWRSYNGITVVHCLLG